MSITIKEAFGRGNKALGGGREGSLEDYFASLGVPDDMGPEFVEAIRVEVEVETSPYSLMLSAFLAGVEYGREQG